MAQALAAYKLVQPKETTMPDSAPHQHSPNPALLCGSSLSLSRVCRRVLGILSGGA